MACNHRCMLTSRTGLVLILPANDTNPRACRFSQEPEAVPVYHLETLTGAQGKGLAFSAGFSSSGPRIRVSGGAKLVAYAGENAVLVRSISAKRAI